MRRANRTSVLSPCRASNTPPAKSILIMEASGSFKVSDSAWLVPLDWRTTMTGGRWPSLPRRTLQTTVCRSRKFVGGSALNHWSVPPLVAVPTRRLVGCRAQRRGARGCSSHWLRGWGEARHSSLEYPCPASTAGQNPFYGARSFSWLKSQFSIRRFYTKSFKIFQAVIS